MPTLDGGVCIINWMMMRRVHFIYVYNDGTCQLRVGIKLAECSEAERSWPGLASVVTLLWHSTTACRFIDDVAYMRFQYSKAGKLMRIGQLPCQFPRRVASL